MREHLEIDPNHSVLGFSAKHLGVSTVRGQFNKFAGWLELDPDDLASIAGEVTVEVESISTAVEQRDTHLRSGDFFDAASHPKLVFKPSRVEKAGESTYKVEGDLTIRGITKPLTLTATVDGEAPNPFGEGRRIGITATGELNRMDFGLNWNGLAGALPLAGHTIKILVDAALVATPASVGATA